MKNSDTDIILGIPKSKEVKQISLSVDYNDIFWRFVGEYKLADVETVEMPEETLNEETVDILKQIFAY